MRARQRAAPPPRQAARHLTLQELRAALGPLSPTLAAPLPAAHPGTAAHRADREEARGSVQRGRTAARLHRRRVRGARDLRRGRA
ncbi:hypothetical protein C8J57DRAFT_1475665, partial [Mycena rebaudengoi]